MEHIRGSLTMYAQVGLRITCRSHQGQPSPNSNNGDYLNLTNISFEI